MTPMTLAALTIAERFCGPPGSANGGYVCGLLAEALAGPQAGPVQVRLRRPTPLAVELRVERDEQGARLLLGTELLVEARAADEAALAAVAPADLPDGAALVVAARRASGRFSGLDAHPYPSCFVCGPRRRVGDGLRIFAGPGPTGAWVAAPFTPGAELALADGALPVPLLWAALDCPGYFAVAGAGEAALLATMTAEVRAGAVRALDECVVVGWALGVEGRKRHAATVLYGADGALCGRSRQLWITV
ncbi:MAG: hypothetical protein IPL40_00225 [Proteobacteria bacterium]|nr:hypothetical protein [Pseudomonadota bacterium]